MFSFFFELSGINHCHYLKKSGLDILPNISFCVSQKWEIIMFGVTWQMFGWTIPLNLDFMSRPVSLTDSLSHPLPLCLSNACNPHVLLPGVRSDTASPQGMNWIKCVMWREFNATAPLLISFVPCCFALGQTPATPSGWEDRGCKATWHTQGDSLSWCAI